MKTTILTNKRDLAFNPTEKWESEKVESKFEPTQADFESMAAYGSMFPLSHFPPLVRTWIEECHYKLGYPIDFIASSMVAAIASAIGNQCEIEVKQGWREKAVLYMVLVGNAGANKSHPMSFAMKPLIYRDVELLGEYKEEIINFNKGLTPTRPILSRRVVSDTTVEGLVSLHAANNSGLVLYADELKSWISNFSRYSSGSQEQFWLSNFSSKPIIVDRRDAERSMMIENPFINVIGSTQPKVLQSFAAGDRAYNGFVDRLLFSIIEKNPKPYWSTETLSATVEEEYQKLIYQILDLKKSCALYAKEQQGVVVRFSPQAFGLLLEWQRYNADLVNEVTDEGLAGMQTKLESYAVRFSLIAHIMRYFTTDLVSDVEYVDTESVELAIKLTEYYRAQAFAARKLLDGSPRDALPMLDANFIDSLPSEFNYEDIIAAAQRVGMSKSSAYRLLGKYDAVFFVKVGYNRYVKLEG